MTNRTKNRQKKVIHRPAILFVILIFIVFFIINLATNGGNEYETIYTPAYTPRTPNTPNTPATINISQITIKRGDINQIYRFFYTDGNLEMHRHRFIDDENLLRLITFDPNESILSLHTYLPAYFEIFYDYESQNVYIRLIHPKEIYEKIVIIDPGDGGHHTGAVVGDIFEKDINLAMGLFLYEIFAQSSSGIRAFLTRDTDIFVPNSSRIDFANALGHMFVSIQNNAYDGPTAQFVYGTEVLYSDIRYENAILAQILQNTLVSELETRDRGILLRNNIHVLREAKIPAVMAEVDFMTSPNSLENLLDPEFQLRAAKAIYRGIVYAFETNFDTDTDDYYINDY